LIILDSQVKALIIVFHVYSVIAQVIENINPPCLYTIIDNICFAISGSVFNNSLICKSKSSDDIFHLNNSTPEPNKPKVQKNTSFDFFIILTHKSLTVI
jgi:hypothetical protein